MNDSADQKTCSFPVLSNEAERLEGLRALDIIGSPREPHFDAICSIAATHFSVPTVLISLIEEDYQWFKAQGGFEPQTTSRKVSFCAHAILGDDVFVVEDARDDARFAQNPLVTGSPGIRFYAGAPLILRAGVRLGALCVIDIVLRTFSAEDRDKLQAMATIVLAHLPLQEANVSLRRERLELKTAEEALRNANEEAEAARHDAEQASQAKTDFLASMSHEMRTPLNSILGFTLLMLEDDQLAGGLRHQTEIVQSAGAALLTVIDDILDFSKIEAGKIEIQAIPFAPRALSAKVLSIVHGTAISRSLEITANIDPTLRRDCSAMRHESSRCSSIF